MPLLAGTPHVRVSRDGGRTYPARHARPLPADPPGQPCTVPVYDPGSGSGRMLALDLDPGRCRPDLGADNTLVNGRADVDHQAAELGQLLERLGARYVADVATSTGGRHVLIPFCSPLPWLELRDVARAIALRFPAVDPAPMCSLGGQISPPGARAKRGGWRVLTMPLSEARAAVEHPNGPKVWAALLTELAAELRHIEQAAPGPVGEHGDSQFSTELDDAGVPWLPRLGGRAPLGTELDQVARTGRWDRTHYADRSAARMAVLGAAVARGWRLTEVQSAVACGAWKGLAGLYARPSEPGRLERLLPYEWRKCVVRISGEKNVPIWLTSKETSRPPAPAGGPEPFGFIRQWVTSTDCAVADPERVKGWGRRAVAVRQLLAAIGQACMVSGSSTIEFGTRNLSLYSGLSQRTVSRLLAMLYAEPDPLLDVVNRGRMARADRISLRIPDAYMASVRWRRRRAGRIDGIHPVFLALGGTAGLVYQALGPDEVRGAEVARAARLSVSATSAAFRVLAEHGLAERGPAGWRRGPVALDDVAESTGAATLQREREARYKQDRESWRARLRAYQGVRTVAVTSRDGWWPLDDEDEYDEMCRWPVLSDDFVRGPPSAEARKRA